MTTTRTIRAKSSGPAIIRTDLGAIALTVIAEPGRTVAELTITTVDDDGTSAEAVRAAGLSASGDVINAHMRMGGGSGSTVIQNGGMFQSVNIANGSVIVTGNGGSVTVNGRTVRGGGNIIVGGSPITVTARVPLGSGVDAKSVSGDIECTGRLSRVRAVSTSGDVDVGHAALVAARTVSGDIRIGELTEQAEVNTTSGDITVHGGPATRAKADSVSGDIRASGGVTVEGRSVSGRVRTR
jgi:DUF4097 and DUF4098 domain-containing protein YvlB